jgi:glutamate-ammonia-ligase adenylyltransferase
MQLSMDELPAALAEQATEAWERLLEAAGESAHRTLAEALGEVALQRQLARLLACSRFAAEALRRRPWLLEQLLVSGVLARPLHQGELESELGDLLAGASQDLDVTLRRFRQRHMLRIVWRDLNRAAPTLETTRDVSWLAEACIRQALAACSAALEPRFGVPQGKHSGRRQELIVIAMGKLGAGELNLSSDVDLIFAYPEGGSTVGGRRSLSNEEYFTRLGRALIAALDVITAEGFVFRVDMRLRPYGESGALAHSFAALEAYYQEQGRDWERYAMVKARPISGSAEDCRRLSALPAPLRVPALRRLQRHRESAQHEAADRCRGAAPGLANNVKLGGGGIREVEFIAQCFQLIRGGRDSTLQRRELLPVLSECVALGCLPEEAVQELRAAYLFLRDVNTRSRPGTTGRPRSCPRMRCRSWPWPTAWALPTTRHSARPSRHRGAVAAHFAAFIEAPEDARRCPATKVSCGAPACDLQRLAALGFEIRRRSARPLKRLYSLAPRAAAAGRGSRAPRSLHAPAAARLRRDARSRTRRCGAPCPWFRRWPGAAPTCCC